MKHPMPLRTLLGHLAAGRLARVQALTAAHRVLHILLRTAPLPPLPHLISLARPLPRAATAPAPRAPRRALCGSIAAPLRDPHLAAVRLHSPASIIRALPASSPVVSPLIADMLVLPFARASQPLAAYEAFLLAGDGHPRHRPSAFSVNALLAALVRAERVDLTKRAFRAVFQRRVSPDVFTFNTVISGLCKVGPLRKACNVAMDIRPWGLDPSVATYNALIYGLLVV